MKKQRWRFTKRKKCCDCHKPIDFKEVYGDFGNGKTYICADCVHNRW